MAPKKDQSGPNIEPSEVGRYVAFDKDGNEIWRKDDFVIGHDTIPEGLSIGMKAMRIVDPKTGAVLKKWDPWDVL